jgi:NADH dehydrogenase/NADH:ubiquinone oxidoreductase subunit G
MERIRAVINGKECAGEKGEFLLDIAERNGIVIPRLCHHESLRGLASCRLCLSEVTENNRKRIVTSCIFPVMRDITAETDTEEIQGMRRIIIGFMLAEAPDNERITALAAKYGASDISRYSTDNGNACIVCGLCVKACAEIKPGCIGTIKRGVSKKIAPPFEEPPEGCLGCGACANVCPTGHIRMDEETGGVRIIWDKKFEMIRCAVCGRYFMTKEQYTYISKESKKTGAERPVCDACSRTAIAEKWMGNTKYVYDRRPHI